MLSSHGKPGVNLSAYGYVKEVNLKRLYTLYDSSYVIFPKKENRNNSEKMRDWRRWAR